MTFLSGWKTYLAAAGLLGQAVYLASVKDYAGAYQSLMGAMALWGLRDAVAKSQVGKA